MNSFQHKKEHITIQCEGERHDATPTKEDLSFGQDRNSLSHVKRLFSSNENISREHSSDCFIQREVRRKDLYFAVDNVKFEDLYDWSRHDVSSPPFLMARNGTKVMCNNKKIALFKYGEQVFAIDENCPHMGGPLHLGDIETVGEANILCVVCPWHKWRLDLTTGKVKIPPRQGSIRNMIYPTRIDNNGTINVGFSEIASNFFNGEEDF